MKRVLVLVLAGVVLLTAACGSSHKAATTPRITAQVNLASESQVGEVLVNGSRQPLYMFTRDQQHTVTCHGGCASVWPPFLTNGSPVAGSGVDRSLLGTIRTPNGQTQVTYNHWPLYTYASDSTPGQAAGQGINSFGGIWSTLTASGQMPASSPTTSTTRGSGGSGY